MLNIAIVGAGGISPAHIKAYSEFPDRCRIVALCDIYPEKAQAKKDEFGLRDAAVYASVDDLLGLSGIDAVSVCTPPFTHSGIAIALMDSGKSVLVEKPMAASVEECDRMLEAERRNGVTLGVIAQNRFTDGYMLLKRALDSGLAGRVLHAQVDSFWWRGHSYYDLWWRGSWATEGGGCTLNHAVHHFDLLNWLMGRPESVDSFLANLAHDNAEVEDLSIAILRYPSGAVAQATSSVVHHGEEQQIVLQCEKARISSPWRVASNAARPNGFPEADRALEAELAAFAAGVPPLAHSGHSGEIDDFLAALEAGKRPLVTGEDGKRTIELISAIYESAFTRRRVDLPLASGDPFYTASGIQAKVRHFHEKSGSIKDFGECTITVGSSRDAVSEGGSRNAGK